MRIGATLEHLAQDRVDANKTIRFVQNSPLNGMSLPELSLPVDRQCASIIALPDEIDEKFLGFIWPGAKKDSYSHTFLSSLSVFTKECSTNAHGDERPCVSCAYCDEVCPAKIIPHLISKYVERDLISETLLRLRIFDCVECNLCSYVCLSKIPVARLIKEGKDKLIEEGYISSAEEDQEE